MTLTFNRQTLPLRKDFLIAGTCCHLSTNSHDILRTAGRCLPIRKQSDARSFEMNIIVDATLGSTSEHPAHFRGLRHLVFAILPPRSFLTYDLLRRRVYGVLSSPAACDDSFWNSLLIPITLGVLGTNLGVAPLHCACLERNGRGFLVAVASGPRRTLNGELAYEIGPAHSIGFTVKRIATPQSIFFLERAPTLGCHIVPCRSQYVRDFFEKSAERLPDELTEAKTVRTSIIRSLSAFPSWILRTGENPHRTAEAVDHFLAEASHARV